MGHVTDSGMTLEIVGPGNLSDCGIGCLSNPRHEGYQPKVEWLQRRFDEGLRFLLFRDDGGKPLAFLEYVPGEYAWRPVDAEGWLFVHCLWVYSKGQKVGGLGSRLIQACVEEARQAGRPGGVPQERVRANRRGRSIRARDSPVERRSGTALPRHQHERGEAPRAEHRVCRPMPHAAEVGE